MDTRLLSSRRESPPLRSRKRNQDHPDKRSRSRSTSPLGKMKIESNGINDVPAASKDFCQTATELITQLEKSNQALMMKKKHLSDELKETRKQLAASKEDAIKLGEIVQEQTTMFAQLQRALQVKEEEVQKQQKELEDVNKRLDHKIDRLKQCEIAYEYNKSKADRQQLEIINLKKEVQHLKSKLGFNGEGAQHVSLEQMQKDAKKDDEEKDKLKYELKAKNQEIGSLKMQLRKIRAVIHSNPGSNM